MYLINKEDCILIFLYLFEKSDPKRENAGIQRIIDLSIKFVVYVSFIIGAISGVGIWFAIMLYSTDATAHLVQKFVWLSPGETFQRETAETGILVYDRQFWFTGHYHRYTQLHADGQRRECHQCLVQCQCHPQCAAADHQFTHPLLSIAHADLQYQTHLSI